MRDSKDDEIVMMSCHINVSCHVKCVIPHKMCHAT